MHKKICENVILIATIKIFHLSITKHLSFSWARDVQIILYFIFIVTNLKGFTLWDGCGSIYSWMTHNLKLNHDFNLIQQSFQYELQISKKKLHAVTQPRQIFLYSIMVFLTDAVYHIAKYFFSSIWISFNRAFYILLMLKSTNELIYKTRIWYIISLFIFKFLA